jgi:hypothetical protein
MPFGNHSFLYLISPKADIILNKNNKVNGEKYYSKICGKIFYGKGQKGTEIKTSFYSFHILYKCKYTPNFLITFSACTLQRQNAENFKQIFPGK